MSEGQAMQAGELIASLDLDDPSARCAASLNAARMILAGYDHNVDDVVHNFISCLTVLELPFLQWQECISVLATRLPKDLRYELEAKFKEYEGISSLQTVDFPARVLRGVLEVSLLPHFLLSR
ncbi:Acetyl-CoA Carboxylase [Datura stramonium]|uniref:Acetyl-CoA Carboxylase n=1 Tax=Datura stramonium TaxID=4076 RepID=A0ABS8WLA5_DATST|nr:Acetyl-CoA Carboxylase [Datura stramonium]